MIRYLLIIILLAACSCNAPRNNPLDPNNPDSPLGIIVGQVKTYSLPNTQMSQVTVIWKPGNSITLTNSAGTFRIENAQPLDGWLVFQKTGFQVDSMLVEWKDKKLVNVQQLLNAIPQLEIFQVYSIILNQYPSFQRSQISIEAEISDSDNDIDSVFVEHALLKKRKVLEPDGSTNRYQRTLSQYDFNIVHPEELIGKDFQIYVKDRRSYRFSVGRTQIKRVITDEIVIESPSGYQIVSSTPTLKWQRFAPNFTSSLTIEIFTQDFPPQPAWEKSGISIDSTNYVLDTSLPPGEYSWVIWCIDEFNNQCRSKAASFKIE